VHELVTSDSNAHVRRTWRDRREEHQVSRLERARVHLPPNPKLVAHVARHLHSMLVIDELDEPAAIEAFRISPAISIRRAAE
jgi:hypothetical protein